MMMLILAAVFVVCLALAANAWAKPRKQNETTVRAAKVVATPKKKRKVPVGLPADQGFFSLLETLDQTFDAISCGSHGASWTDRHTRAGLKRMGPYVPYDGVLKDFVDRAHIDLSKCKKFSTLIFVAVNGSREARQNEIGAEFIYAQRLRELPWNVEPGGEVFYEVGIAYRETKKKLFWVNCYVSIDPSTGRVRAHRELRDEQVRVNKRGVYCRKKWGVSPMADRERWGSTDDELNDHLAQIFVFAYEFWTEKDSMWTVSVRKNSQRVTFCVPDNEAKTYFANREKTALTKAGKRRPIIHFVNEHKRDLGDGRVATVKEHIRGLREFIWERYSCAVSAPKYHLIATRDFDFPAMFDDHDEVLQSKGGVMTTGQLAARLADIEDKGMRIH